MTSDPNLHVVDGAHSTDAALMDGRAAGHRLMWLFSAVAVVAVGLAGYVAGRGINTNSTATSGISAPRLTAAVERGALQQLVVGSAVVEPAFVSQIGPPVVPANAIPVATAVPLGQGDSVDAGTVVLSVANRPVIVLPGSLPAYRPMVIGTRGPDVAQLQAGLAALGYEQASSDPEGAYGQSTAHAVGTMYRDRGYPPLGSDGTELEDSETAAMVPLGELVFVDGLPGVVTGVTAAVGQVVSPGAIALASGTLTLLGTIPTIDAPLVGVGQYAEVRLPNGDVITAEVAGLNDAVSSPAARSEGQTSVAPPGTTLVLLKPTTPVRSERIGQVGNLSIESASSADNALQVPITAIRDDGSGRTWVVVVDETTTREVDVVVGLNVGGRVVVEPTNGQLDAGDEVVLMGTEGLDGPPAS